MPAQTSMIHVRVDDTLKAQATDALAGVGLTVSDAVRILLTRVAAEGGLPAGLTASPEAHDAWFRAKVREALADPRPATPHDQVMADARALIDGKLSSDKSTGGKRVPELAWSALAVADLMAIVDYISDDNPAAALALMEEIEGKVAGLPAHPKRCRPGRVEGTRELVVRPNYIVIYAETPATVTVLRVLHAAQMWP